MKDNRKEVKLLCESIIEKIYEENQDDTSEFGISIFDIINELYKENPNNRMRYVFPRKEYERLLKSGMSTNLEVEMRIYFSENSLARQLYNQYLEKRKAI